MSVCLCHAVSERKIREAAGSGAATVAAVARSTRAGTCCGACVHEVRTVLARVRGEDRVEAELPLAAK